MLLTLLAGRANSIAFDDLPTAVRQTALLAIFDTFGVTLAGSREQCVAGLSRAIRPAAGACTWIGTGSGLSALDAALINGTASHALDFDDCSNTMGGHPSAPIIPGLFALAEERGASGRAFLDSYVVGFEVEARLGRAVNFAHYEKGWHPTSTLGTFGSAAACARLIGLPDERFATALAIAASMASGLKANFGTMTKPYHVGHASRNGLLAALLAAEGMTANLGALEDDQGFFNVYNGPGTFDADKLLDGFASPFDLAEPGVAFKRHPCCASTHPALDALLQIMDQHRIDAAEVAAIRSWTHPRRLKHTNRPAPGSGLEAKFSVQYVLARAALEGSVKLEHFEDTAIHDLRVRALMAKIEAAPHPEARMDTTEHFYADVRVTTTDGRVFDAHVDRALGRDRDHPLPPGALERKFRDCAGLALTDTATAELEAALLALESQSNMADLGRMMRDGCRSHPELQQMLA